MLGTELTYEYVGTPANPNQYHVVARLFRDLTSVVDDPMVTLTCGKNECGNTLPGSFTAILTRTSRAPVATGCATGISYELNTLEGLVQLAPAHWTLSINLSNRQVGVVNVTQSQNQTVYIKAELDNTNGLINSSPRFTTARIIQLTSTLPQRYSVSVFDSEGDSLVYQLVQPLSAATSPCGVSTVGAIAPHFQLNAATGELQTVSGPIQQGLYAMAVQVNEYRRIGGAWQPIGSVMRDMNYLVSVGTNQPPVFTSVTRTGSSGTQLLGQPIRVSPGETLSLALTATDADAGQVLSLSSSMGGLVPGTGFQDLGGGQGLLTWQVPATQPLGRYGLTATAQDNACPVAGANVLTLPIIVAQRVLATRAGQQLAQAPFPMPFRDEVHFQLAGQGQQAVLIVDELGRTVAQLTTAADGSATWQPATGLPAGSYFARTAVGTQAARLSYLGR